jgi:hypothetical protein
MAKHMSTGNSVAIKFHKHRELRDYRRVLERGGVGRSARRGEAPGGGRLSRGRGQVGEGAVRLDGLGMGKGQVGGGAG